MKLTMQLKSRSYDIILKAAALPTCISLPMWRTAASLC